MFPTLLQAFFNFQSSEKVDLTTFASVLIALMERVFGDSYSVSLMSPFLFFFFLSLLKFSNFSLVYCSLRHFYDGSFKILLMSLDSLS